MTSHSHPRDFNSQRESVILFGSQTLKWSLEDLSGLQERLQEDPDLTALRQALLDLPTSWPFIEDHLALSNASAAADCVRQLSDFAAGKQSLDPNSLQNVHLGPLTILDHVWRFILNNRAHTAGEGVDKPQRLPRLHAAQGFCIGFLTATALSSAKDWNDFQQTSSQALRLAACIGAVADSEDASHEPTKKATTIAVRWKTDGQRAYLDTILDKFATAYITCFTDKSTATVTLSACEEVAFCSGLESVGIAVTNIGVHGSFHSSRHSQKIERLEELCQKTDLLKFPSVESLQLPLRSTVDSEIVRGGSLTKIAGEVILGRRAHWYQTVLQTISGVPSDSTWELVPIGKGFTLPRSLSISATKEGSSSPHQTEANTTLPSMNAENQKHDEIAVVGLACRFPEADSLKEFWQLISSGKTALGSIPTERFKPDEISRNPSLSGFKGNFLREPGLFDHRFFGISGREAKSMDPQQRLTLQVAYEALESAGYFSLPKDKTHSDIGCYLGVGSVDYESNVASEDANAFSATGTLRAFISGRVSHFFGWTGPSITMDTACSSSAVAIHSACKALLSGECSMALAGGVNIITSPNLYQNLAAASFLNPEGSSKAFDEAGKGYCRGEGAGILILKPLSQAIADQDMIFGVIAGTAVNQGSNCSPITVPDSKSQSLLYEQALSASSLQPEDVTYVEAHGTGTPVGDPIEFDSIRSTFGGLSRHNDVFVGSVKDNIGHAESASGVAGVIKVLLMIRHGIIPKQANFTKLTPRIKVSSNDRIKIPQISQAWNASMRAALVNNYGAAGSNAAIVIRAYEKDPYSTSERSLQNQQPPWNWNPILLSASSPNSLRAYLKVLRTYLPRGGALATNIPYDIARRQNPGFEYRYAITADDEPDFISKLQEDSEIRKCSTRYPVVFCFGGQTSRTISLSKDLYDSSALFREYLDGCEAIILELGLPSLFPAIFQDTPVEDLVALHCMLFSLQYSSAKSWLDTGLKPDALIGHSFGQLTALCISGSISQKDALRFVAGRARLMRDEWGAELGSMISIEGSRQAVEATLAQVNSMGVGRLDMACCNGSQSFVVSGDSRAVSKLEEACSSPELSGRFKLALLRTSQAYHSYLSESIIPGVKTLAESLEIREPYLAIETCSPDGSWQNYNAENIAQHTRQPVYFYDAIERIATRLPAAVWLEIGSATPIISMTRRILADKPSANNIFIPSNLGSSGVAKSLANASSQLWLAGHNVHHWLYQKSQQTSNGWVDLPPYQFEKNKHWLDYQVRGDTKGSRRTSSDASSSLVSLAKQSEPGEALFTVDTTNITFDLATKGHAVAGQSLCPASMYIELAARCAALLAPDSATHLPQVESLAMTSPLGLNADVAVFLRLQEADKNSWNFALLSQRLDGGSKTEHATGQLSLVADTNPMFLARQNLLKKLARNTRSSQIVESSEATGIKGSMVYKIFRDVVEYAPYYQGVTCLSASANEVVGVVTMPGDRHFGLSPGVCDPIVLDNFLQVAGIHVNCLSDRKAAEVFMCTAVEEIIFTRSFMSSRSAAHTWTVYSRYEVTGKGTISNNIFVYDSASKELVLSIIGAIFRSVPFKSVVRNLSKLNMSATEIKGRQKDSQEDSAYHTATPSPRTETSATKVDLRDSLDELNESLLGSRQPQAQQGFQAGADSNHLDQKSPPAVREMISEILEIPLREIEPSSQLVDLGIDSLLATEVLGEVKKRFGVDIKPAEFLELSDISSLCQRIETGSISQAHSNTEKAAEATRNDRSTETGLQSHEKADKLAVVAHEIFQLVKNRYDEYASRTAFEDFCSKVLPLQSKLVVQYVVDAFSSSSCDLSTLRPGDKVPMIQHIPKHRKLVLQLYDILESAGLVSIENKAFFRTSKEVPQFLIQDLHQAMVDRFPQHASETKLLYATGPRLADCLAGTADPIGLIFRDSTARTLLEDVYTNAPMFKAGTLLLDQYLDSILRKLDSNREIKILELGAGTGGTTKHLVETLARSGTNFTYTFTDLSPSLVAAAKRKFSEYPFMRYTVLDIERNPDPQFTNAYDIIISTNCIHATKDLVLSTTNIRKMLRSHGILCLVELTRNLYWFDLVFGLLEGWWLFNDGRKHVLANEQRWKQSLRAAGYQWIDWSHSFSQESEILRVITASPSNDLLSANAIEDDTLETQETLVYKDADGLELKADIYFPAKALGSQRKLPVALMIHGGGHVMLSREDIRPEQTAMLLNSGFLPISIDYRLCPEKTLLEGPMTDVCDALDWVRNTLPTQQLKRPDVKVLASKVVCVGWSTGGTLAMSLAWTSIPRNIQPPDAILAFYCPSDYEDTFWRVPNIPVGSETIQSSTYNLDEDIWSGIHEQPITSYNVAPTRRALGGWLAPKDPRSRLALYMNWHGRTLHVLINGLDKKSRAEPPEPSAEEVAAISPLAHIRSGEYKTPTFIIHPRQDDLIPWQQAERTWKALRARGVDAELRIVEDVPHLFDLQRQGKNPTADGFIREGYEFLCRYAGLSLYC